jgi:hypothetical protein
VPHCYGFESGIKVKIRKLPKRRTKQATASLLVARLPLSIKGIESRRATAKRGTITAPINAPLPGK